MAPSRRKGVSRAAAAAAARRKWKVGDLVLAKVKGFPAWPATVSEPEKWGYSADWKKVLVYFFGTQQIAFCNPADVEAFTEEKKQSLLTKRQGKGADFVRAVQEIIESYEKLKEQARDDDIKSGGEVTGANGGNSVDSSASFGSKDQTDAPGVTLDRNGPTCVAEDASAGAESDAFANKEQPLEEHTDTAAAAETPLPATYFSRKRYAELRKRGCVTQMSAPVRRSRSSSRVHSAMTLTDRCKFAGDISANAVQDVPMRRKRTRKSPSASGCDDVDSAAFVSNGSIEDNGSEIVTVESDAFSLNDGSTIDSNSKLEHSGTVECVEGDVELNRGLDLQIKAVFVKKKRKPNRKRLTNDASKPTITPEKEANLEVGMQNTTQSSQNSSEKLKESCSREDGDEHLPLVKRARVRMGKSSSTEVLNSLLHSEVKNLKEDIFNLPKQVITSSNCDSVSPADEDSSLLNGGLDNISPSKGLTPFSEKGSQLCKIKKDQTFSCSLDGEAALPPSKRLHRALEAMSANAAEEGEACREASSTLKTSISDCCKSSSRCACMAVHRTVESGLGMQGVDSSCNNASQIDVSGRTTNSNPIIGEEILIPSAEVAFHSQPVENSKFQNYKARKDVSAGAGNQVGGDDLNGVLGNTSGANVHIQLLGQESSNCDGQCGKVGCDEDSLGEGNIKINETRDKASDTSQHAGIFLDPFSDANVPGKFSPQNSSDVPQNSQGVTVCENTKSLKPTVDDNNKVIHTCEVVEEVIHKQGEEDTNSNSFSDDRLGEKGIFGIRSSPSLIDGGECLAQGSPPNTSVCNMSTSDSSNILQSNGSCSPDVHLPLKRTSCAPVEGGKVESLSAQRPKFMGKSAEAGHAALVSFEAALGTLTRTKESIGRATRIAIDCAKFGVAAKVVEILARNLETEPSLHRRVDLFFLVDSITQCSRGFKGDGGVYPSAIQAVLSRLLSAAAPPGNSAQENRRQCLKVLRLWLERRILPESFIRHHMRELDYFSGSASGGRFSRRSLRNERALDDPVRDMEGMLVDEYGSNSSFQLPGFCMPRMLKDEDEGSDSDGGSFEAVTPEHNSETCEVQEMTTVTEKHRHILEDVDGELEMEDVAPPCEVEMNSFCDVDGGNSTHPSHGHFEKPLPLPFAPPLPQDVPVSSPPLPPSPPPLPPPPPPPPSMHLPSAISDPFATGVDSKIYTDMQKIQDYPVHSVGQQLVAPRNNQPISDVVHYRGPESRDLQLQIPESTCSFSSFPVPPPDSAYHSDGMTMPNKGYPMRPPQHAPSSQFSFVCRDQYVKPQREAPPPLYPNRYVSHNMERDSFYNNHERIKPPPFEFRDSWRAPAPYPGPRYQDKDASSPYGCHPCEPPRLPGHGWTFPPRSLNSRNSIPFRPHFEGAIPVSSRGPSFWGPR
ncbi:protein HUA2-LIKE 3 [Quillaja saponaria]|uniref:Protein HUA2-LIKE 3 n=1 Tax=Quillaja saponaria TaxID=32244 RepID=A0AAD7Q0Y2_QUISA|nr:protein HUA2-LIKE 3 [Quillaja saponaria]